MATDIDGVLSPAESLPVVSSVAPASLVREGPATKTFDGSDRAAAVSASDAVLASDMDVIPVLRETLHVSKREVERGKVVIHKTVSERDEAVEMLLRQTDVSVERVPVGRTVTEAPAVRQDGDVMIVPVMEEVLVVEKRLVLKEELHIRRTTTERTSHEVVRLRAEHVEITPTGDVSVRGGGSGGANAPVINQVHQESGT